MKKYPSKNIVMIIIKKVPKLVKIRYKINNKILTLISRLKIYIIVLLYICIKNSFVIKSLIL